MTTTIKQHDRHKIRWQIVAYDSELPQDITGATVRLLLRRQYQTDVIDKPMGIDDAEYGIVFWLNDGSLDVGTYDMEIEVTTLSNEVITSPSRGYKTLVVEDDLG